jgi:hypothetical protein
VTDAKKIAHEHAAMKAALAAVPSIVVDALEEAQQEAWDDQAIARAVVDGLRHRYVVKLREMRS